LKKIGITLGDQAGIGPEIVAAALADPRIVEWFPSEVEFRIIGERIDVQPGQPDIASAQAALDALEESVRLLKAGEIDAIVTAPVAKEGLHKVGFDYPGQTEFFAERLGCVDHAMCLTGARLTVALVTIHVPISSVASLLKESEIVRVGHLLEKFCRQKRRSTKREGEPRIAVCGLNPHAGENSAFGSEDQQIIAPAIAKLNQLQNGDSGSKSQIFSGPHPADTIFKPASEGEYDAVLCMYHDQGLIPLKLLDFATGVNTTLGLSHPRTSPDHGTAFDIAGKGLADHESMLHAIKLAVDLA
jgi:4-hydroxythreonine-4-phosphate dehydrogenase